MSPEFARPTSDALMASGFSAEEVATMSREALHALASEIMPQSLHLRRLLSDALPNTWAATQGVQEVAATRRSSKGWRTSGGSCFCNAHAPHSSACVGDSTDDLGLGV